MNVSETPFVLDLANVMHLATDVTGVAADSSSCRHWPRRCTRRPRCGTPTTEAALISEIEGLDRGRYAGPVGWIDASGDGEWGIALRCAEIDPATLLRLRLFAGWDRRRVRPRGRAGESVAKLVPMRDALTS